MRTRLFGAGLRSTLRESSQTERVLAVGRALLAVTALIAIYLDPTEPAQLRELAYGILVGYALYSIIVLAIVSRSSGVHSRHGVVLHCIDMLWASALTAVSQGPVSPFFLFFLFAVVSAAHRWGFRETVGTAVVTVGIVSIETVVAIAGPWQASWFAAIHPELNRAILRIAYLVLTGLLLGYLAEQEKRSRRELAAIASAARQPNVTIGLGGSVAEVARALITTFNAASVSIVVRDQETRRTLLLQVDRIRDERQRPPSRRIELSVTQQAAWLFEDYGRTWHAMPNEDADGSIVRVTEPDSWRLKRLETRLPPAFVAMQPFRTVTVVNLGLPNQWQARAYLFDVVDRGGLERRLHFLEGLAEHVTPALTNVFLLRRLRSRAGAAERARVARELHDGAIQALFGMEMKIEAIRRGGLHTPEAMESELTEIQSLLRSEVLSLRELMQALRPVELDSSEQLPEVLSALVERFRRDTGISARFIAVGPPIAFQPARALEIVRIVQEALVNVRKHSQAQNVLVRLSGERGGCRLVVEDDGCGFEFEGRLSAVELDERRMGPAIIKERARIAGADLAVDSTPGSGTRVELTFPEEAYA
jgi:signal transduction histidine kinase